MHRHSAHTSRPEGQVTRGKTAPNRLRSVDHFLACYDPGLISRRGGDWRGALYVDLGYGAEPTTTLESAARLRHLNPELPVLGVEIEPERVQRDRPFVDDRTDFRLGGFNMPLEPGESIRLVRAFNVLRQYEEDEALPACDLIMDQIRPGGLFMDGTSDPFGRTWTGMMLRRTPDSWHLEALVLGANLRAGFDAEAHQTRLPKSFIHRMIPGEGIFEFMEAWKASAREMRAHSVWGPRDWFTATGRRMAERGYAIARQDKWLRRGWLVWLNPDLSLESRATRVAND